MIEATAFASVDGSDDATRTLRCLSLNSRSVSTSSVSSDSSCAQYVQYTRPKH